MISIPPGIINMGAYFASSSASRLFMFLCLPVITSYLSPSEYGMWSVFYTIIIFIIPFSSMMMRTQIARSFFKVDHTALNLMVSTISIVNFIFALILLVPVYAISLFKSQLFGISIEYFYCIPLILLLNDLKQMALLLFRYKKKVISYSILEITQALLNVLIILWIIFTVKMSWELMLISFLLSLGVSATLSYILLVKDKLLSMSFDKKLAVGSLCIGAPLVPHAISTAVISLSDRLILEDLLGIESVGIYSVVYMLGAALGMFTTAFNKVWGPWIVEAFSHNFTNDKKKLIVKYSYLFTLGILLISLIGGLCSYSYIKYFLSPIYLENVSIVYWVLGGMFFQGLYFCIFHYMTFLGKTKVYALLTVFSASVNIFANVFLIKHNGIVGAAQATFIAYLLTFVLLFLYNQIHMPMPWLYFLRKSDAN